MKFIPLYFIVACIILSLTPGAQCEQGFCEICKWFCFIAALVFLGNFDDKN